MPNTNFPSSSLIVSTYNWPVALSLCLSSIAAQTVLPDEVIVADDGSGEDTAMLIKKFQKDFPVPLIHVWQADEGFQLARIRNKAIASATKEYIIQIDGDLILHRKFVEDHLRFSQRGSFVSGSRVIMDAALSKKIIESGKIIIPLFNKGIKNIGNGLWLPVFTRFIKKYRQHKSYNLRGCNMAFWKDDLLAVNGYNEAFQGWGREDSELVIRLLNLGLKKIPIKFGGIVFHLFHPEKSRLQLEANEALLTNTIDEKHIVCSQGIKSFLNQP